ncbi:hypothetical protein M2321_002100 [Rhodoblastus acidophilus]|nr:hypothetical protein [Rhodoblastus acidophilus]
MVFESVAEILISAALSLVRLNSERWGVFNECVEVHDVIVT